MDFCAGVGLPLCLHNVGLYSVGWAHSGTWTSVYVHWYSVVGTLETSLVHLFLADKNIESFFMLIMPGDTDLGLY